MTSDPDVSKLAEEFPNWRFWRGRTRTDEPGDLMATRRRDLSDHELRAGLALTLPLGVVADLRSQLVDQAKREDALGEGP